MPSQIGFVEFEGSCGSFAFDELADAQEWATFSDNEEDDEFDGSGGFEVLRSAKAQSSSRNQQSRSDPSAFFFESHRWSDDEDEEEGEEDNHPACDSLLTSFVVASGSSHRNRSPTDHSSGNNRNTRNDVKGKTRRTELDSSMSGSLRKKMEGSSRRSVSYDERYDGDASLSTSSHHSKARRNRTHDGAVRKSETSTRSSRRSGGVLGEQLAEVDDESTASETPSVRMKRMARRPDSQRNLDDSSMHSSASRREATRQRIRRESQRNMNADSSHHSKKLDLLKNDRCQASQSSLMSEDGSVSGSVADSITSVASRASVSSRRDSRRRKANQGHDLLKRSLQQCAATKTNAIAAPYQKANGGIDRSATKQQTSDGKEAVWVQRRRRLSVGVAEDLPSLSTAISA